MRFHNNIKPNVINKVKTLDNGNNYILEIATRNQDKLKEFSRILKNYEIFGKDLKVPEIQSIDPVVVISEKAKLAYEINGYNPIIVEDTSMEIKGLNNLPGTYVNDFFSSIENRKLVAEELLKTKDRTAIARVMIGIYDGEEVHFWEGKVIGLISKTLKGANGFGWDDLFIPIGQPNKKKLTFAEMTDEVKDFYSMRKKAIEQFLKNPPNLNYPIYELPEPYPQEIERIRLDKLQNKKAIKFAYSIETIIENNKPNSNFSAPIYSPFITKSNIYFTRYLQSETSKSIGLMLTDIERENIELFENGNPKIWQMGKERRRLALAQRTEFFMNYQNKEVHNILDNIEKNKNTFPKRNNRRSFTIENALGIHGFTVFTKTMSLKEIGYKKIASSKNVSRTISAKNGLFNMIGKHARSFYSIGCLPWISGWRDIIVMGSLGHMPVFVHRNNINAIDMQNQIDLINDSKNIIKSFNLGKKATERAFLNIGAAIGPNPKKDLENAKRLYSDAGIKLFRIYTINSDPRLIETAFELRNFFGDEIEIFAGQLVDKRQCDELISPEIRADGFIFGHGGGRQCTSATNGMALSTLEEVYEILIDRKFNNTSILVEGGIGTHVGAMLVMGVDGILRNAQFTNGVIEQGEIFFKHKNGHFCQPYHGSASAPTMIIESYNKDLALKHLQNSGRAKNVEGKPGYIFYEEKANSMAFYVDQFYHYAARTLVDFGVESIWELREFLEKDKGEYLRIISQDAAYLSSAWKG